MTGFWAASLWLVKKQQSGLHLQFAGQVVVTTGEDSATLQAIALFTLPEGATNRPDAVSRRGRSDSLCPEGDLAPFSNMKHSSYPFYNYLLQQKI